MAASRSSFRPPHCPNPECTFHVDPTGWRFKRAGFFDRLRPPRRVQRYRCTHCGRAFSTQTFRPTYWLKRPDLLVPLLHGEVAGSGHRQLARQHGVAHSTVQRQIERLGRHCLLLHERLRPRARARAAREPLVLDGLGSFAGGQYWVLELTGLIGARSTYSHDFVVSERRRSGSMTKPQRARRARYERRFGRPDPRALERDVRLLLEAGLPPDTPITLLTDEKHEYGRALRRLPDHRIQRQTTHSKAPRTPHNPLFPINAHHMFLRHSGANHKRETVAFSKRIQAVVARHAIFQAWRNLVKAASERRPDRTPAQRLGVVTERLTVEQLLAERLFPTRIGQDERTRQAYQGRIRSRFRPRERTHELGYAF